MPGNTRNRCPAELKARAVRLVVEIRDDHDWERPAMAKVSEVLEVVARGPVPASLNNAC